MNECYEHEKLRRQGSYCPYCRIAELETRVNVVEGIVQLWLDTFKAAEAKKREEEGK